MNSPLSQEKFEEFCDDLTHRLQGLGLSPQEAIGLLFANAIRLCFETAPSEKEATLFIKTTVEYFVNEFLKEGEDV